MHTGNVQKPKGIGRLVALVVSTLVIVGFLISPAPKKREAAEDGGSVKKETLWSYVVSSSKEDPAGVAQDPTLQSWRICWEEPDRAKAWNPEKESAPCAPGNDIERVVDIKEYNSARFVFTVSWKEDRVFKERALFVWDKIASPSHGTWHQLGSDHKDGGTWRMVKRGDMFVGWHTSDEHKQQFTTTMEEK